MVVGLSIVPQRLTRLVVNVRRSPGRLESLAGVGTYDGWSIPLEANKADFVFI
jgi:hypothetical protein